MKDLIFILFAFNLIASDAMSNGNGVGNGGDAVVCNDKTVLLDLLKADIALVKEVDPYTIAAMKFALLKESASTMHKQYQKVLSNIKKRTVFIKGANFRDIKDSFEISLPKGCEIKQIAIQQDDEFGKRKIHFSFVESEFEIQTSENMQVS